MFEEKFFAIFKSYINDLVDVAVKNTLKQYGFDEKESEPDKKKQDEQDKKYEEQERKYQEQQKQKQQDTKKEPQDTKKEPQDTKKTPFDEFQEQFNKYKKFSDKFEDDDKKTTDNNQKKTNDYQQKNQQKTTKNPTVSELEQQYYVRLGITSLATWEQIKAAYKSEMKKYHPDKYASEPEKQKSAEVISQKINEAYHYFEKKFKK